MAKVVEVPHVQGVVQFRSSGALFLSFQASRLVSDFLCFLMIFEILQVISLLFEVSGLD